MITMRKGNGERSKLHNIWPHAYSRLTSEVSSGTRAEDELRRIEPGQRRPRAARRFLADVDAAAAIEFALLGMSAFGLVLEPMQVGLYFYENTALERATYKAARLIKIGTAANKGFGATEFRNALCSSLPAGMPCANLITNVQNLAEGLYPNGFYKFVKADQSGAIQPEMDNSQTLYCPGGATSFVYIQVYYAMPVISLAWRTVGATQWNGKPVHFLRTQTVFRNEPYMSGSSGC